MSVSGEVLAEGGLRRDDALAASTACRAARFGLSAWRTMAAMPPKPGARRRRCRPSIQPDGQPRAQRARCRSEALGDLARTCQPGCGTGTVSPARTRPAEAVLHVVDVEVAQRSCARAGLGAARSARPAPSAPAASRRSASRWRRCRPSCRRCGSAARRSAATRPSSAARRGERAQASSSDAPAPMCSAPSPHLDALELGDLAECRSACRGRAGPGDPQAHVGRAGEDLRVGAWPSTAASSSRLRGAW